MAPSLHSILAKMVPLEPSEFRLCVSATDGTNVMREPACQVADVVVVIQ